MATLTKDHSPNHTDPRINELIGPRLAAIGAKAPIAAGIGLVLCLAGLALSPKTFFQSYLFAYMFWFGVTIGSMAFLMLHHVVGGGWGF
ncbi:hypothetical protein EON80_01040, partial [bacterium]